MRGVRVNAHMRLNFDTLAAMNQRSGRQIMLAPRANAVPYNSIASLLDYMRPTTNGDNAAVGDGAFPLVMLEHGLFAKSTTATQTMTLLGTKKTARYRISVRVCAPGSNGNAKALEVLDATRLDEMYAALTDVSRQLYRSVHNCQEWTQQPPALGKSSPAKSDSHDPSYLSRCRSNPDADLCQLIPPSHYSLRLQPVTANRIRPTTSNDRRRSRRTQLVRWSATMNMNRRMASIC